MDVTETSLICPFGEIGNIKDFGVTPADAKKTDSCINNEHTEECFKPISPHFGQELQKCIGKAECSLKGSQEFVFAENLSSASKACNSDEAVLFVQFSCIQSVDLLINKRKDALLTSCLSIFVAMVYLVAIYYLKENSKLTNIEWDVATVTAGDFSVEYTITPEMYGEFIENHFSKHPNDSPGFHFKLFLKEQVEAICTDEFKRKKQQDALMGREANDKDLEKIEIAEITFAYNNS